MDLRPDFKVISPNPSYTLATNVPIERCYEMYRLKKTAEHYILGFFMNIVHFYTIFWQ